MTAPLTKLEKAVELARQMKELNRDSATLKRLENKYGPAIALPELYANMLHTAEMIKAAAQELERSK